MTQEEKKRLNQLMERYAKLLLRYAYSYCGNQSDSEDILQEVYIKYMKRLPKFKDENHERAWFLRVTINTAKDYVNSFWYRKTTPIEKDMLYEPDKPENIWDVVQQLPEKYRMVIQLYYKEGYSIREISSILRIRESTVGTQLGRARELLKRLSKEE